MLLESEMGSLMELSNVACLKLGCVSIENGCERYQPSVLGLSWDWFSWFPSLVYVPMCRLNKNDLNGFYKVYNNNMDQLHDSSLLHYIESMTIISSKLP